MPVTGPLQRDRWGDIRNFREYFGFVFLLWFYLVYFLQLCEWSIRPQEYQLRGTTSTLNKTHGVVATQASGTWGAGHAALPHVAVRTPEPWCLLWGATPVRRRLARCGNGQQEVHHGTQSHGKPRNRQPNAETGCSYFSRAAFTLSTRVKSYLVTRTLGVLSNDCSLVTAFLWGSL